MESGGTRGITGKEGWGLAFGGVVLESGIIVGYKGTRVCFVRFTKKYWGITRNQGQPCKMLNASMCMEVTGTD